MHFIISFWGQLADYYSHIFSLIHPLDKVTFKEMRTWSQSKISSRCLCVWCKSRELRGRWSQRFPTRMVEISADLTSYKNSLCRVAFGIIYIASAESRGPGVASHQPAFMDSFLTISHTRLAYLPSRWISPGYSIESYLTESHVEFRQRLTTELLCENMWSVFRWLR